MAPTLMTFFEKVKSNILLFADDHGFQDGKKKKTGTQ